MKAISSLVNVDSIDNDKNLGGGGSEESIVMSDPNSLDQFPGTVKMMADCGDNLATGFPSYGFTFNSNVTSAGLTNLRQAVRTVSSSETDSFALVLTQFQPTTSFLRETAKIVKWVPSQSTAEVRHEILEAGDHQIDDASRQGALLFSNLGTSVSSVVVSLEGPPLASFLANRRLIEIDMLDPSYLYNRNDQRFHTADSSLRATALPVTLAPLPPFAFGDGRNHLVGVK